MTAGRCARRRRTSESGDDLELVGGKSGAGRTTVITPDVRNLRDDGSSDGRAVSYDRRSRCGGNRVTTSSDRAMVPTTDALFSPGTPVRRHTFQASPCCGVVGTTSFESGALPFTEAVHIPRARARS